MKTRRDVLALGGAAALAAATGVAARAQAPLQLRISVDTAANHTRNIALQKFVERLRTETRGAIAGQVFDGGQLYVDRDVSRAVARGDVEMAAPATSAISAFESNFNILQLPIFSGLTFERINALIDGPFGAQLNQRVEQRMGVVIPGAWFLLGFANTYTTKKPLRAFEDLRGMRVRIPGGAANVAHYRQLGADPLAMPFADVPLALTQGTVDGLLTTDETIRSGKLWESGLANGFVDLVSVFHYVPIVSQRFWRAMSAEQQGLFRSVWKDIAAEQRGDGARRQADARTFNEQQGMRYVDPGDAARSKVRESMQAVVPQLISELKIDRDLVDAAAKELGLALR